MNFKKPSSSVEVIPNYMIQEMFKLKKKITGAVKHWNVGSVKGSTCPGRFSTHARSYRPETRIKVYYGFVCGETFVANTLHRDTLSLTRTFSCSEEFYLGKIGVLYT